MTILGAERNIGLMEKRPKCPFTNRETAVLQCYADDMTKSDAASALGISGNTVEVFSAFIAARVGERSVLSGVPKAIIMAVANDWVKTDSLPQEPDKPFTSREEEVVQDILWGKSNLQVRQSLHISEGTLNLHLASIRKKLRLKTRNGVVAWVAAKAMGQLRQQEGLDQSSVGAL